MFALQKMQNEQNAEEKKAEGGEESLLGVRGGRRGRRRKGASKQRGPLQTPAELRVRAGTFDLVFCVLFCLLRF